MGVARYEFKEVRFIIESEMTQVYVLLETTGDMPLGVKGWHHKAFPKSISMRDILLKTAIDDDPVLWPQEAPES